MKNESPYDRDEYSRRFARLLNKALDKGNGDPEKALEWLNKGYKPFFALLFTRYRLETTDAYMDVREHIQKRIAGNGDEGE